MPKKPIRHGIMIKAVCCAKSGYDVADSNPAWFDSTGSVCFARRLLHNFVVQDYTTDDKRKPGFSEIRPFAASNVALFQYFYDSLKRVKDLPYLWVADSGYSSVKVARWALAQGQRFVGAIKGNFSGIKADMLPKKSKKNPTGTAACFRSSDGQLLVQGWTDRGQLNVLTTECKGCNGFDGQYCGGMGVPVTRRREKDDGSWLREEVMAPEASALYQAHYQKVDYHDRVRVVCACGDESLAISVCALQFRANLTTKRSSHRWYYCLWSWAFETMLVQSFLMHRFATPAPRDEPLNMFLQRAMRAFVTRADALEDGTDREELIAAEVASAGRVTERLHAAVPPHAGSMVWLQDGKQHVCHRCKWRDQKRSRANVQCVRCSEFFCHRSDRDCFKEQHEAKVWYARKRKREQSP